VRGDSDRLHDTTRLRNTDRFHNPIGLRDAGRLGSIVADT
jgi:hypothetical protein